MYWTPAQQLAHLTVNGAAPNRRLCASGTVSGPRRDEWGSLMELTWNGERPLTLGSGARRGFLEDADTVSITAAAGTGEGRRIGFGEVVGTILPAAGITTPG